MLIISNFSAVLKIVVSWTLPVHPSLQLVLRSGSLTSQKNLKYNKLSRVKEFSWSGIGIVMLFCCWTTSPKVDLLFKHVIMLKMENMNCSSRKQLSDNSLSIKQSENSTASWHFFLSKSSENIFSVKNLNSLVKLTAYSSGELIFLRQLCKVDTISLGFSKEECRKRWQTVPSNVWTIIDK